MLSDAQKKAFDENGYVVIEDFKSAEECEALRAAAMEIVDDFDAENHRSIFSTEAGDDDRDAYFLTSGDKVRCFFEAGALNERGELIAPKPLAINKIGHAMHDLIPAFSDFSRDARLGEIMRDIGLATPEIWQSMYIFKQPHIGGEVRWHQDATYFFTEPQSVKTLWFAIDDATLENGCLWVGEEGPEELREHFELIDGAARTTVLSDKPWPTEGAAKAVPVRAGTLVCFDGALPHYSAPNTSSNARHAYTLHVTDGAAHYPSTNWIQRSADFPVRGFERA